MKTLVVAELLDGNLRNNTLSAIQCARQVSEQTRQTFDVVCIGEGAPAAAKELSHFGAAQVWVAELGGGYVAERFTPTLAALIRDQDYRLVVATATAYGKDLMPRLAAKLNAAIVSDISSISITDGRVLYRRPMYAGNIVGTVQVNTPIHVVTVRQAEFSFAEPVSTESALLPLAIQTDPLADRVRFVELRSVKRERPDLAEARIVVAGGRGLKSAENFKTVLEPLVDALGAAMGASRAACDAGYVPGDLQVGQTGKVVAPDLYIAVGISGAIQHVAGIKGAKVIVAINKDKEAPIAQVADYFWTTDLFTAVPELTAALGTLNRN